MKKGILILIFLALVVGGLNSQPVRPALGLRAGYDAQEISYQQPLGHVSRLEMTFGVNMLGRTELGVLCRGFVLNGLYQWVNDFSTQSDRLKWYVGMGAAVLDHGSLKVGKYGAGVTGQVGVEWNFDSPWQLSLDYRPGFYWLPGTGKIYRMSWNTPCLALRYHL
jgi:hypothetical protein